MKKPLQLLCLGAFLAPGFLSPLLASETRVDSAGGLSLVMTDETAAVNPFVFGNPAGLSLLAPQNRFDAAFPWFQETPAGQPVSQVQAYGALPQLGGGFSTSNLVDATASNFKYQGFLLFPTSQWAFQADGDWLYASNQTDTLSGPSKSLNRYRGMARTAYNFGPLALGTQVDLTQADKNLPPHLSLTGSSNGQGSETVLTSTSGLLVGLPLDNGARPSYLRLGGVLTAQLSPSQEKDQYTLSNGGNPIAVDFVAKDQDLLAFGPGIYLDLPDRLQAAFIGRFAGSDATAEADSSNSTVYSGQAPFKAGSSSSSALFGVFKARLPLAGKAQQILSFNTGSYLSVVDSKSTNYGLGGNTLQTSSNDDLQWGIGAGLESADDFTVGVQASLDSQSGSANPVAGSPQPNSFFSYRISAGGERWLTPQWAFRMGLQFEDDYNGGSQTVPKPYYTVAPGQRWVSSTLTAGIGYQDPGLKSDLLLWTGQPSQYGSPNPENFLTQAGAELAFGIFFN